VTARYATLPPRRRGPDGERLCRWCADPVPKGRREWCGDQCVREYRIRNGMSVRGEVFGRDRGVCRACRFDCPRAERLLWECRARRREERYRRLMAWLGRPIPRHRVTYWDVDHIVRVVDGGGACGLDNLQTLCLWCHRRKTAAQQRGAA